MYEKSGKDGRRPEWLNKDLFVKLRCKKEMHSQWNQRQVSWEEYREVAWMCRNGIRKVNAQLEIWQGMWRIIRALTDMRDREGRLKKNVSPPDKRDRKTGDHQHEEGWGTQYFCLSFQRWFLFPHLSGHWNSSQGLGEQSLSHCRRSWVLKPPGKPEPTQAHEKWWDAP